MGDKIGVICRDYEDGKEKGYLFFIDGRPSERNEIHFRTHKAATKYAESHFADLLIIDDSRKEGDQCQKKRTPNRAGRRQFSKKLIER